MKKCRICLEVKPDEKFRHVKIVLNGVEVLIEVPFSVFESFHECSKTSRLSNRGLE